jgi:hypothetical protein
VWNQWPTFGGRVDKKLKDAGMGRKKAPAEKPGQGERE